MLRLLQKHRKGLTTNVLSLINVTAGLGTARVAAFVTGIIVARIAGAEVFGEFTLFVSVFSVVMTVGAGLDTTFIRFAGAPGADEHEARYFAVQVLAKALFAGAIIAIGWVVAPLIADLGFQKAGTATLVRNAIISGGLIGIYQSIISLYRLRDRFLVVALLLPLFNLVVLVSLTGLLALDLPLSQDLVGIVYVMTSLALAVAIIVPLGARGNLRSSMSMAELTKFFRVGLPLLGASLVTSVADRFDVFLLTSYVAFADLGHYGVAVRIAGIMGILTEAAQAIVLPKAAATIHDRLKLPRYLGLGGGFLAAHVVASALVIMFATQIVGALFGPGYLGIEVIVLILVLRSIFMAAAVPFRALVQCSARPSNTIYLSTARLIISAALLLVLIPRYGALGAAYGAFGTAAIMFVIVLATARFTAWPPASPRQAG